MVYSKSFRINCIARVALITLSIYIFFYLLFQTDLIITASILGFLPLFQLAALLEFVDKTNTYLTRTFESVQYNDFSERINTSFSDSSFAELCAGLNHIVDKFQKNRLERERQFQYLQAIVDQTGIGLISLKPDGEVDLINKSARNILKISPFRHIRQLESTNRALAGLLSEMKSGEQSNFTYDDGDDLIQMVVTTGEIRLHLRKYTLVTLHNIQSELEEKEMDAWKKLIRVLSHEIMNSLTPISSLAGTASALIGRKETLNGAETDDLRQAVQTMEKRSRGLMQFVRNYRQFARIPRPDFQVVPVRPLFQRMESLLRGRLEKDSIQLITSVEPETLLLRIDPDLIEQALLNLTKNAIHALKEAADPTIRLTASVDEHTNASIRVIDNGAGIDEEAAPRIFIPFFSTRRDGSGIGLSLSRQIMRLHGGSIRVKSTPGVKTVFTLKF